MSRNLKMEKSLELSLPDTFANLKKKKNTACDLNQTHPFLPVGYSESYLTIHENLTGQLLKEIHLRDFFFFF